MSFWGRKSTFFISGVVFVIAGFIGMCWWLLKPTYVPLLQQENKNIQASIINILASSNIPYSIKNNIVQVEENRVGEAKIALDKGGLSNPETIGFELFNETDYGMSDFAQKINFQRALEGELARSIMTMDGIKYARVHLTPEKDTIYEVDKATAKASVVIETKYNYQLDRSIVDGIQSLIASAVNGLDIQNVILLNAHGEIISNNYNNNSSSLKRSDDIEEKIERKVRSILFQSFDISKASVSANVQVNFDKKKVVSEKPILSDAGIALLSKKQSSSNISNGDSIKNTQKDTMTDSEYAMGKEISEIEYATGKISKISVGVIVPNTLSFVQLQNIQQVLEVGLGIDKKRGDNLVLVSSMLEPVETQPDYMSHGNQSKVLTDDAKLNILNPFNLALLFILISTILFFTYRFLRKKLAVEKINLVSLSDEERERIVVNLKYWLEKDGFK